MSGDDKKSVIYQYLSNLDAEHLGKLENGIQKKTEEETLDKLKLRKKACSEWMAVGNDIDERFNTNLRFDRNCISNYVIKKVDINTKWLKKGESIQTRMPEGNTSDIPPIINQKYNRHKRGRLFNDTYKRKIMKINYADWYDDDEDIDIKREDYIRLHRINLNRDEISLQCPHCNIFLQCISIPDINDNDDDDDDDDDDHGRVAFICFNFPRCKYPLEEEKYQRKYIWDKVLYVGPVMNTKNENELLYFKEDIDDDIDLTYKEVNLSSFADNKTEYMQWSRHQDRLCKKLTDRINWKRLKRKSRHNKLQKECKKWEQLKSHNIKSNKDFIYHVFKNRKNKINKLRQKRIMKLKHIFDNVDDGDIDNNDKEDDNKKQSIPYKSTTTTTTTTTENVYIPQVQEYIIKNVINATKVTLVAYPTKKYISNRIIYPTRSRTKNKYQQKALQETINNQIINISKTKTKTKCKPKPKPKQKPKSKRKPASKVIYKDDLIPFDSLSESDEEDIGSSYSPSPMAGTAYIDDYIVIDKKGRKRSYNQLTADNSTLINDDLMDNNALMDKLDDDQYIVGNSENEYDPLTDDQYDDEYYDQYYDKKRKTKIKNRNRNKSLPPKKKRKLIKNNKNVERKSNVKYKRREKKFEINEFDKLTFIDLYKMSKNRNDYSNKWLYERLKRTEGRYKNMKYDQFNKWMKDLIKPNTENELVSNLALQQMPIVPVDRLPFTDKLAPKKQKKIKADLKNLGIDLRKLPEVQIDLNCLANTFKIKK